MNDQQVVNALKGLVIDGVGKANSGHPGGPMSSMDFTYILFTEYLKFDPEDPQWLGRDRFILSAGHMSMLLYAQLYARGWLTMDDLKAFRQLHSKTPGHPENHVTPGVECTTGPLGQGCAMSIGFAAAAAHLGAALDKDLWNHRTWVVCSDGDLQEGVALGAASLAGHMKLNNLVWVYDRNSVQLSGPTNAVVSDHDETVFAGFGWRVVVIDGHDHDQIRNAYNTAVSPGDQPTIIICNTVMAKGAYSLENSFKAHGEPMPPDERTKTKEKMGLPKDLDFYFPEEAQKHYRRSFAKRSEEARTWKAKLAKKLETEPKFKQAFVEHYETDTYKTLPKVDFAADKQIATRDAFGEVLGKWGQASQVLFGGSADLEPSNKTGAFAKAVGTFTVANRGGRNVNFGVREFPMSAFCNGVALHGGLIPFDATFLSFADYSRPALRLSAIQKVRVLHVFTHDSFYLGEDGPTHEPVEQVMSLRLVPELHVLRPADPIETEAVMRKAMEIDEPSILCLTRQKVPFLKMPREQIEAGAAKGAYVVHDTPGADLLLLATGSEVSLALAVAQKLTAFKARVVSMPCWELFAKQPKSYQDQVIPPSMTRRVSIEAGTTIGWGQWTGLKGLTVGIDHFGASAPAEVLAKEYGFTPESICERIAKHQF